MQKIIVIASSSFTDKKLFEESLPVSDNYFVKSKSIISEWLPTATTFTNYNKLDVDKDTKIIAFWDGESKNVEKIINQFPKQTTLIRFENLSTKSFMTQLNLINNPDWKKAAISMTKKLPNYFWVAPASSSGKYHPKCDLGVGGLVRHSVMVAQVAMDLYNSKMFKIPQTELNEDTIRIAALFHDCLKQGDPCTGHTVFEHPIYSAEYVVKNLTGKVDEFSLARIEKMILRHMGQWTTSNYSDITLEYPKTEFERLLHTADYIASQKYIGGLEDWK